MRRRIPWSAALVLGFIALGVLGPWVAPSTPLAIDLHHQYEGPSASHWLGTADNGADVLSTLLYGARLSFVIAFSVVAVSVIVGTALGVLAGYRGGLTDTCFLASADLVQAFPAILLNIAIMALVARPGAAHMIGALSANGWVLYARIARAQTLSLREREFVAAARALGASEGAILWRHIVPNLRGPLVIQATSGLGSAVLAESTLSFLGLGPGQTSSWGALLDQGSSVLLRFPHVALIAGATIASVVLGFNRTGDWLRDRFDPKS